MTELNVYDEVVRRRPTLPKNLLIVDGEETSRELCAAVSAPVGLHATSVSSAELALEVLEQSAVDITSSGLQTSGNERPGSPQARD
jgi:CheY-like chemotaxis protein